jgi:hypothetical protein
MLPAAVKESLLQHLQLVKRQHEGDLRMGLGRVALPYALERKYSNAEKEWGWQWAFPATSHYIDAVTGEAEASSPRIGVAKGRLKMRALRREFLNLLVAIRCDIPSQLTCWRVAMTFEPFKGCWGIRT